MILDIHTHVLPSLDDGPSSLEESLEMLKIIDASGIDGVILTPHFDFARDELEDFIQVRDKAYRALLELVKENQLNIDLYLGCEIMYSSNLSHYNLGQLSLAKTDYLLIELPVRRSPIMLIKTLNKIMNQGYIVILAHVERYSYLLEDANLTHQLIEMGVLFQVNSSLVLEEDKQNFFKVLMKHNLVHFISSDCHDGDKRKPDLHLAMDYIRNNYTIEEFEERYKRLIQNELIEVKRPGKLKKVFNYYF